MFIIILLQYQRNKYLKSKLKKQAMQPQRPNVLPKSHENSGISENLVQNATKFNEGRRKQSGQGILYERKSSNLMQEEQYEPEISGEWKKVSNINILSNQNVNNALSNPSNSQIKGENVGVIFNRINHCSFFYKNSLYYYGGLQATPKNIQIFTKSFNLIEKQKQTIESAGNAQNSQKMTQRKESLWNSFHKYNTVTKQFSRHYLNIGTHFNLFNNVSSFGYLILGNLIFIFGGVNYETLTLRNPQMCSINLQTGQIKRYESKTSITSIPTARLNPTIAAIQKNILLLFGGQVFNTSTSTYSYINDMYTFKTETKTWTKIQDNLHLKYPIIVRPWVVNFGDNCIYLLGGKKEILRNDGSSPQLIENRSMYRLKILTKTVSFKADCCIRQIFNTNPIPNTQIYVKIIKYNEKGLFAITTDAENPGNNIYLWYYDQYNALWTEIKQQNKRSALPSGEDFSIGPERIFSVQYTNQILSLDFNNVSLESIIKDILSYKKRVLCSLCEQEKQLNYEIKHSIPAQYYQQYCSALEFPFSAIGMLVDNTVLAKAKNCSIYFNVGYLGREPNSSSSQDKQKQRQNVKTKYLIIEDNGFPCCIWSPEMKQTEFIQIVSNYSASTPAQELMESEDNRILIERCLKQIQEKQRVLQKQFQQFQKNQSKNSVSGSNTNNQNIPQNYNSTYNTYGSHSHSNFKNEKDFERQQHQYIQKKQRLHHKQKMLEIEEKCKKFCNNLKLAGLKLGECIIYACKQKKDQQSTEYNPIDKQIRRYFFMRKEKNVSTNRQCYVCYAYITQNNVITEPKMEHTFKFVSKQFKKQLKIVTERLKTMNNVVLITDLKNICTTEDNSTNLDKYVPTSEMRMKKKQNDVFYGQNSILNCLQANNAQKMTQCCDISLKTYLSLLYLNSEQLNLSLYLSVRQSAPQYINTQPFLTTIDKLNSKKFIEVSKSLEFGEECNVVEVYWYPEHSSISDNIVSKVNSLGFLLNGILIYHQGRLITRHNINLGQLLDKLEFYPKYGSMFGFLQIKEQYGANIYSTDVFYPRTFEKYFARINFVSQFMESKYSNAKPTRSRPEDYHSSTFQKIHKKSRHQ